MPGAARLLRHLRGAGVPVGMATSTPRATYRAKMAAHPDVADSFQTVHCGDEVRLKLNLGPSRIRPACTAEHHAATRLQTSACRWRTTNHALYALKQVDVSVSAIRPVNC